MKRPLLRYYGGKFLLSPWIISFFPFHEIYCEPFGGGGSVLLQKPPTPIEIYNDLDGRVVNFFKVLRDRPEELKRAIELTPFARDEYELSAEASNDDLEDARRLYVSSWQSKGSGYSSKVAQNGWRYQNKAWDGVNLTREWNRTQDLWDFATRLKKVQIESDEANTVIARYDTPKTFFYIDPPYLLSTRSKKTQYFKELTESDHIELCGVLKGISGMAIVSGYPSDLYNELYADWQCVKRESITNAKTRATECLWISPNCQKSSLPLFNYLLANSVEA